MKLIEKIGRFSICVNRGAMYLRWWDKHQKKTISERLDAETLELSRIAARSRIRILADRAEMI